LLLLFPLLSWCPFLRGCADPSAFLDVLPAFRAIRLPGTCPVLSRSAPPAFWSSRALLLPPSSFVLGPTAPPHFFFFFFGRYLETTPARSLLALWAGLPFIRAFPFVSFFFFFSTSTSSLRSGDRSFFFEELSVRRARLFFFASEAQRSPPEIVAHRSRFEVHRGLYFTFPPPMGWF